MEWLIDTGSMTRCRMKPIEITMVNSGADLDAILSMEADLEKPIPICLKELVFRFDGSNLGEANRG